MKFLGPEDLFLKSLMGIVTLVFFLASARRFKLGCDYFIGTMFDMKFKLHFLFQM